MSDVMANSVDDVADSLRSLRNHLDRFVGGAARRISTAAETMERRLATSELADAPRPGRPKEELEATLARVREALERDDTPAVTRGMARSALREFARFEPPELRTLLAWHETTWKNFIDALFRNRFALGGQWGKYARVAVDAPESISLLHGLIPRKSLLLDDPYLSAELVAREFSKASSLEEFEAKACASGLLHRAWPYTSLVAAEWCAAQVGKCPPAWREIWKEVSGNVMFEAMLLPRGRGERSWFKDRQARVPMGVPGHIDAWVQTIACAIRAADASPNTTSARNEAVEIYCAAWTDPRTFELPREKPVTEGWKRLAKADPEAYNILLDQLLTDDLDLFFKNVEFDKERRKYWLKHLGDIVSTTFVFCAATKADLLRSFHGQGDIHRRIRSAIERASSLQGGGRLDALCLTFRDCVVVEFSQVGNAAYKYSRENFEKVRSRVRSATSSSLKDARLGTQLIHSTGWQRAFDNELYYSFLRTRGS